MEKPMYCELPDEEWEELNEDGKKKEEWISNKIAKLIGEGKSKEQDVAIAYSMYKEKDGCGKKKADSVERFDWYDDQGITFQETPEGFLTGVAIITNVGVFEYKQADGTIIREARFPEDVFDVEHIKSYEGKALTNNHPWEAVTADNIDKYGVGSIGNAYKWDDYHLAAFVTVQKRDAVNAVKSGKASLSCGYTCDLEPAEPGAMFLGMPYDYRQRNIRGNHLSIVEKARAGDSARIRMDSANIIVHTNKEKEMENMKTINLDGVDYNAEAKVLEVLNAHKTRADSLQETVNSLNTEKARLEAERDQHKDAADTIKAELEALKANHVDASEVAGMVKERVALEANAKLAGLENYDSMSNQEIKVAIVKAKKPNVNLDGKPEAYVDGWYDGVVAELNADSAADAAARAAGGSENKDSAHNDGADKVEIARKNAEKAKREAWKNKE